MIDDLLACPNCHQPLQRSGEQWSCGRCGVVGRTTLGFADFVGDDPLLPMAAGGTMDLRNDEEVAAGLLGSSSELTFTELCQRLADLHVSQSDASTWPAWRRWAQQRFHRNLARINTEGEAKGGEAILAKIDNKIAEAGWPPLGGRLALEAGGGEGLILPAFSSRFGTVVFVDASVANIVLAAKLAEERKLENVLFVRADVTRLPFGDDLFDFVHQNGVVEHVHDPVAMVNEGVRVRSRSGYYVCVSPNGMAITPEPHFGLPVFGLVPGGLRRVLIPVVRGGTFEQGGTDPRSLRQLRSYLRPAQGDEVIVYFLPRHLPFTARQTPVRRLVQRALSTHLVGDAIDTLLNRALLPVMPQHIAIVRASAPVPSTPSP
ncbi:MAG: class I SAM-dependent methyltransferase [Actinomycetota bacterium]|nr:class I SAM-dependent methyltransferase [Actinomycetota bacterium]